MHTYTRHLSIETCRAISKKKFTAISILPRAFLIEGATCRSAMMIAICVCYQLNQETMPSLRLLEIDHFSCLSIFLRITITTILDLIREKFLFFDKQLGCFWFLNFFLSFCIYLYTYVCVVIFHFLIPFNRLVRSFISLRLYRVLSHWSRRASCPENRNIEIVCVCE